jgi:hypothetical protein
MLAYRAVVSSAGSRPGAVESESVGEHAWAVVLEGIASRGAANLCWHGGGRSIFLVHFAEQVAPMPRPSILTSEATGCAELYLVRTVLASRQHSA